MENSTKTCNVCAKEKTLTEFHLRNEKRYGICADCENRRERDRYHARRKADMAPRPDYKSPWGVRVRKTLSQVQMNPEKLRAVREKRGFSQEHASFLLGASRNAIGDWETGRRTPSGELILRFLLLYRISPKEIIDGYDGGALVAEDVKNG